MTTEQSKDRFTRLQENWVVHEEKRPEKPETGKAKSA